jgi:hypothetical protein
MAVHKATRSNPKTQLQPQRQHPNHQLKAEIFDVLRHLNRGFGVALAAFDKLETKDRSQVNARSQIARSQTKSGLHAGNGLRIFTEVCLREYRDRTQALQAQANRDLLRLMAAHEDQHAERSGASHR